MYESTMDIGTFQSILKETYIRGIFKGEDKSASKIYRPIALTSCVWKTMERMVLPRLTLALEEQNFLKNYQSGFKRLHSTIDCLVRLESAIQETFKRDEYMVAVFLDIEKAYDMLW